MEGTIIWKRSIDDIKIVCKHDGSFMILESTHNNKNGIYI